MRRISRFALVVAALAPAACATTTTGERMRTSPPTEYHIGREDVLEIVVWHEPELTRVIPVRPDGRISLPLAGEIEAAGLTPVQLRDVVTRALAPYVRDASVAVLVREVNGPRFSVMGEVAHPGTFPLRGSLSVTQGLATAGGLGEFAGDEVIWLRHTPKGKTDRVALSVKEMLQGQAEGALLLGPGDVLYVP